MSLRGQCIICTSAFTPTTVFALPCGHTFHEQCIGQWLDVPGRGCPNCRRRCRAKDVTRIFFDVGGLNDTLNVTTQKSGEEALLAKNHDLRAALNHLAAEASKARKDLSVEIGRRVKLENLNKDLQARLNDIAAKESKARKDLSVEIDRRVKLETLVATEKKATQKLELIEAELLQVRSMLHDVNETKSENKVLKQQTTEELWESCRDLFLRCKSVDLYKSMAEFIESMQPLPLLNDIKSSNDDEFDKIRVAKGLARQVLPSATTSETTSFKSVMDGRSAQVQPISETLKFKKQFTTGMKSNKAHWK